MSTDSVYHLVYVSAEAVRFSEEMLIELLTQAREHNAAAGITGLLLHKERNFIQVLEGSREAVERLFASIRRDPRHRDPLVLDEGLYPERQFADWSMGFLDTGDGRVRDLPGFSRFMETPVAPEHYRFDPKGVIPILEIFRRGGP